MKKYNSDQSGIPFWLVVDSKDTLPADSKMQAKGTGADAPGDNSDCPAIEKEAVYCIEVL
jgi:hypothetical protein